ncbi:hypothetical protein EYF80_013286 [Liparis tanakae]|uniref:Uncharacterized protein n=1 Tax=Liparis tanakae TaxID=230148 RepID=A0A4Z2IF62_9TELE|nr:hypothetical protein EYF80_013286 [Liparis tanakae]
MVLELSPETEHSSAAQVIHVSPHGPHGWVAPNIRRAVGLNQRFKSEIFQRKQRREAVLARIGHLVVGGAV